MLRKCFILFSLPILLAGSSALLRAQVPTGTISGAVTDPSGAAVINVKILVTSTETGFTRVLSSGVSGDFSASALTAGHYRLEAEAQGFKKSGRIAGFFTMQAGLAQRVPTRVPLQSRTIS